MTPDLLLRQVPPELADALHAGALKLFGSVLRDTSSGRIAGFLQETGAARQVASALGNVSPLDLTPVGAAMRVADLGMAAAGLRQGEQIKAQLGVVTSLGVGNLLLTGVGIGVSVAGFAILSARIGAIGRKVDGVADALSALARSVDGLRRDRIAEQLTDLKTVAERYEEGWISGASGGRWRDTAIAAHALANQFGRLAGEVLDRDPDDLATVEPFADALALAISLRVNAWLAAGEGGIALSAADAGAQALIELCDRLNLGRATLARMATAAVRPGESGWGDALDTAARALRQTTAGTRARESAGVSTALMIRELVDRNLPGRRFLAEARAEDGDAVKYLPMLAAG